MHSRHRSLANSNLVKTCNRIVSHNSKLKVNLKVFRRVLKTIQLKQLPLGNSLKAFNLNKRILLQVCSRIRINFKANRQMLFQTIPQINLELLANRTKLLSLNNSNHSASSVDRALSNQLKIFRLRRQHNSNQQRQDLISKLHFRNLNQPINLQDKQLVSNSVNPKTPTQLQQTSCNLWACHQLQLINWDTNSAESQLPFQVRPSTDKPLITKMLIHSSCTTMLRSIWSGY